MASEMATASRRFRPLVKDYSKAGTDNSAVIALGIGRWKIVAPLKMVWGARIAPFTETDSLS